MAHGAGVAFKALAADGGERRVARTQALVIVCAHVAPEQGPVVKRPALATRKAVDLFTWIGWVASVARWIVADELVCADVALWVVVLGERDVTTAHAARAERACGARLDAAARRVLAGAAAGA